MRTELIRWVKLIILAWPLIGFVATFGFLMVFYRPLRQILERFNCCDLVRLKIGPLEIEKRRRRKRAGNLRRERKQSAP